MTGNPTRTIRLFGTDEPPAPTRILRAGPLSAEFEAGNLRYIRLGGIELIRAVSFIARDAVWGTYTPEITDLTIEETPETFRVTYSAVVGDGDQTFRYDAVIEARADGYLRFEAHGRAATEFVTNRTGFVVLHPLDGVAGTEATIEDADGLSATVRFPDLIAPYQPMTNLRAITHAFAPGARVTCRMEGDVFEMEDQRNWTDASFKTYCRPLGLPWPYALAAGTEVAQAVTVSVIGKTAEARGRSDDVSLRIGAPLGTVPALGIGIDPADMDATAANADMLRTVAPGIAVFRHDPNLGHNRSHLEKAAQIAGALGAEAWLQLVVRSIDGFAGELAGLGATVAALGSPFDAIFVSPAADLSGVLPGSTWPPCPPLADLYDAARKAFPGVRLGGGMFAYFTELNRKRPPMEDIDLVTFQTSAINHAADDRSVSETLETLPHIAATARIIAGGMPYVVGPSGIGVRDNPYNDKRLIAEGNVRMATAFNDPRQRSLFGAVWNLGYFSRFAYGGAEAITFCGGVGAFGLVHTSQSWQQPFFDAVGGVFPTYHVARGLAALRGAAMREVTVSDERRILALAAEREGRLTLWAANLSEVPQRLHLDPALHNGQAIVLDANNFVDAAADLDFLKNRARPFAGPEIVLDSYAAARLVGD